MRFRTTGDICRSWLTMVTFHLGDYKEVYAPVLHDCQSIDFLILDGAEDGLEPSTNTTSSCRT